MAYQAKFDIIINNTLILTIQRYQMSRPKIILTRDQLESSNRALKKAIEFYGSQRKLALALKITPQAITHLLKGHPISLGNAIKIEQLTKGEVKRSDLRPDYF